ncbi:MAG TPA: hypothetical protein VIH52_02100 [Candidatus Nanoarchaeia archaeon]
MKVTFTRHALNKQEFLRELGWDISLDLVEGAINNPEFQGQTKYHQPTAIKSIDQDHVLRVVYEVRDDIISVITFHVARKGRYAKP